MKGSPHRARSASPPIGRLALVALLGLLACSEDGASSEEESASSGADPSASRGPSWFVDRTTEKGLDFVHHSGADGRHRFPEMGGSGGALLDADEDGRLDLYLLDGGALAEGEPEAVNRLYLQGEDGRFRDATEGSGADLGGYSTGCAVGDVDGDGHLDLYVGRVFEDAVLYGTGDGHFESRPDTGVGNPRWASSLAFLDQDGDGFLDVYVANYVIWPPEKDCPDYAGRHDYCNPASYPAAPDVVWLNDGRGAFRDASDALGVRVIPRRGLGVGVADFDLDGDSDVYVANDGEENHLWINAGAAGLEDRAAELGVARNRAGRPEASMGVAVGDLDGDGDADLFTTHLRKETNTLYMNEGARGFTDATARTGLANASVAMTGFGTLFLDFDHDGDLDLAVANGRVVRGEALGGPPGFWRDYREPNQLFECVGVSANAVRFEPRDDEAHEFTRALEVSRGLLAGDLDDDGDLDLVVTNVEGPARIYLNETPRRGHWLMLSLVDEQRTAYGARIRLTVGERQLCREINPAQSYLGSVDPRAHFGLGEAQSYDAIEVHWPDGSVQRHPGGPADRHLVLTRQRP